jgi:hypothetical protein
MVVSGRIGAKRKMEVLCCFAQSVKHNARLHARILLAMIQFEQLVTVLGEIENYCEIAALSAKTCASTA